DVVTADLCDAPAGIRREQMPDSPRKLPCTTGVIDVAAFLRGLVKIGYDGPVGTEPFDKSLSEMSAEEAMTTATAAMKKAFALIG
ncbi:MAG: sugar phosphate isomerase/epimerase, partial [Planctomycetota bacterium]|nr:sugar phosphate isomerase/epimerase [Planctomycetota bacterium]